MFENNFRGITQPGVDHYSLEFYLWGHLIPPVNSAPIENKETLQHIIYACPNLCHFPLTPSPHHGTFENLRQALIRRFQTYIVLCEKKKCVHLLLIVTC